MKTWHVGDPPTPSARLAGSSARAYPIRIILPIPPAVGHTYVGVPGPSRCLGA